jgi:hypothetical protein
MLQDEMQEISAIFLASIEMSPACLISQALLAGKTIIIIHQNRDLQFADRVVRLGG